MDTQLKESLKNIVQKLYESDLQIDLLTPPERQFGDKSTNIAMVLAKSVRKSPLEIAENIKKELENEPYISKVEVAKPGFINIFFNTDVFLDRIINSLKQKDFLHVDKYKGKKLIIEHTASNPNKHLHIGHLRNFCIGDSLGRLMRKTDYDIEIQWFNNDQGLQIAKVLWGLKHLDLIGMSEYSGSTKYDIYCGKVYSASEKYITTHEECETDVRQIIQKMEEGGNETSQFAEDTTRNIIKGQLETVFNFSVTYDDLISESTLTQSGVLKKVINTLMEQNKITKEEDGKNAGCIVIKNLMDDDGNEIPDKVLIRSDGTAVYTAKDIALFIWKFGLMDIDIPFEKFVEHDNSWIYISTNSSNEKVNFGHADAHINVVDTRQAYPLEVVRQSLKVLGFENASQNYKHLKYEVVALSKKTAELIGIDVSDGKSSYAMSGRKGHEVSIDDLLAKMTEEVKSKKDISEESAKKIAAGALRYYMLKFGYNNIITFDIDEALKSDGDTGIYLQYSYVRANSILQKSAEVKEDLDFSQVSEDEKYLIMKMYEAKDVISKSVEDLDLQRLCVYTFELCKNFSLFYQKYSVLNEPDEVKKNLRIYIVSIFLKTLEEMLDILGIYKPEKM